MRVTQKQRDKPGMPDSLVRERHSELRCACDVEGGKMLKINGNGQTYKNAKTFQVKYSESETDSKKKKKIKIRLSTWDVF